MWIVIQNGRVARSTVMMAPGLSDRRDGAATRMLPPVRL
jgi:hypothetical protein